MQIKSKQESMEISNFVSFFGRNRKIISVSFRFRKSIILDYGPFCVAKVISDLKNKGELCPISLVTFIVTRNG